MCEFESHRADFFGVVEKGYFDSTFWCRFYTAVLKILMHSLTVEQNETGSFRFVTQKLLGSAMVSTPGFDPGNVGSIPAPTTNVVFRLIGKAPHCE